MKVNRGLESRLADENADASRTFKVYGAVKCKPPELELVTFLPKTSPI